MLKRGDKGYQVMLVQKALMAQDFALPRYGADGDYGEETEIAVKKYQAYYGFPQTGVVNDQIYNMLVKGDGNSTDPIPKENQIHNLIRWMGNNRINLIAGALIGVAVLIGTKKGKK